MNELDLEAAPAAPLAEILRPKTLDDVVGQAPLLGPQGRLRLMPVSYTHLTLPTTPYV